MIFDSIRKEIEIQGQKIVLVEMDALNFTQMLGMKDEGEAVFLVSNSIESPKVDIETLKTFPASVVNELTVACIAINGLSAEGNLPTGTSS
jgi:predicted transcriptional regulator